MCVYLSISFSYSSEEELLRRGQCGRLEDDCREGTGVEFFPRTAHHILSTLRSWFTARLI